MNAKVEIEITAYWGNSDAESTIKLTIQQWKLIQSGAGYTKTGWSYYEGERLKVMWRFADGKVCIDDEECRNCIVDAPISELLIQEL